MPDIQQVQAWQRACIRHSQQAAMAQGVQVFPPRFGSGRKDASPSPSNLTQTNGVKMEGGKERQSHRKDTSTSGRKSHAVASSHDSEEAESEFESNDLGQPGFYGYPPYPFMPMFYPFYAPHQGFMPVRFQQDYGAFVVPAAPNSGSASSKPLVQGGAREDEIISAASPDRLARSSAKNQEGFTTSRKPRSGGRASDAPDTS